MRGGGGAGARILERKRGELAPKVRALIFTFLVG